VDQGGVHFFDLGGGGEDGEGGPVKFRSTKELPPLRGVEITTS